MTNVLTAHKSGVVALTTGTASTASFASLAIMQWPKAFGAFHVLNPFLEPFPAARSVIGGTRFEPSTKHFAGAGPPGLALSI